MTFGAFELAHGDVLATLRELPDNSFDALMSDPPYGFRFMGKAWDYDVPSVDVWREALRVLKPGAPLVSFGGSRTFHRIATAIEDAGFELRDCLMWLYGKGFPKSLDVSKALDKAAGAERRILGEGNTKCPFFARGEECQGHGTENSLSGIVYHTKPTAPATDLAEQWDGYGTALKPAWEPIILARKPLEGTVAANVAKWGVGALAIDDCRIEAHGRPLLASGAGTVEPVEGWGNIGRGSKAAGTTDEGRWPANLVLAHDRDCVDTPNGEGCVSDCPIYLLDRQAGNRPSRPSVTRNGGGNAGGDVFTGRKGKAKPDAGYSDAGGPSRFFYSTKVSTAEREYGCENLPKRSAGEATDREDGSAGLSSPRAGAGRGNGAHNHHPTLKPLGLNRWLASLIRPPTPNAMLLVPYAGAGSEVIGALQAGWSAVFGIEGEAEYIEIARARIAAWGAKPEAA